MDFASFYRAERRQLVRFVMFSGCADADMAEDIVQEAFVRAFQRWDTLQSPKAWLRTVSHHEFLHRCRTANRETSLEAAPERARPGAVAAALAVEQQADTREVLAVVIGQLPPKQRLVMAWHWDGFNDAEIAVEIGDSAAAVRKNRNRALKKLRQALAQSMREAK